MRPVSDPEKLSNRDALSSPPVFGTKAFPNRAKEGAKSSPNHAMQNFYQKIFRL
jgi:hypothetical protein